MEKKSRFNELALRHFEAYLEGACDVLEEDKDKKQEKADYYVRGLLEKGGPSTDVFKKALGEETTAKLFKNTLFGIAGRK